MPRGAPVRDAGMRRVGASGESSEGAVNLTLRRRNGGCEAAHRLAYHGGPRPVEEGDAHRGGEHCEKIKAGLPLAEAGGIGVFFLDRGRVHVWHHVLELVLEFLFHGRENRVLWAREENNFAARRGSGGGRGHGQRWCVAGCGRVSDDERGYITDGRQSYHKKG